MATVKIPSPAEQHRRILSQCEPIVEAAIARIVQEMEKNPARNRFILHSAETDYGEWIAAKFVDAGWEATFSTGLGCASFEIVLKMPMPVGVWSLMTLQRALEVHR